MNQIEANTSISRFILERQVNGSLKEFLESQTDNQILIELIESLRPSANNLREFLRLASDISARDKISLEQVFVSVGLENIISSPVNIKDKQRFLKEALSKRRYPELSAIQNELENCVVALRKETNLRLELPEDLEGDSLKLSVSMQSPEDFREIAKKIDILSTHPLTQRIYAILRGEY